MRPVPWATQTRASGHAWHRGWVGVQTIDPRSMSAWLNRPGARRGTSRSATSQIGPSPVPPPSGASWPTSLAITRREFASTTGARTPNAIEAMAPAV